MAESPGSIDETRQEPYLPTANLTRDVTRLRRSKKKPPQFASALVHEVRNPLSNINLAVEMLKSLTSDDNHKIYLDIIVRGAVRINDLVTDFLTSFQAEDIRYDKHSIHQLLDEVIARTEDRIRLKNITIRKEYEKQDFQIMLNKEKMQIALTNIIINAIDAMPSENGELVLTAKLIDGKYIIEVKDNGCGISKENLNQVFKPFFTKKPGGLGLGLATTYHILKSNHVGMNVESVEGKGTCFTLTFDKDHH